MERYSIQYQSNDSFGCQTDLDSQSSLDPLSLQGERENYAHKTRICSILEEIWSITDHKSRKAITTHIS